MKIAIYTLCRDRLEYTKISFQSLIEKSGVEFDHYVIDNGSKDGTVEWLKENESIFKKIIYNPENVGISVGSNQALDAIFSSGEQYDLIVKMDNDCEVLSENMLGQVSEIFQDMNDKNFGNRYILSPYVEGIVNQPKRARDNQLGGRRVGLTGIVGGLFHIVPASVYKEYRYPIELPKAWGQDDVFCKWFKDRGGEVGYIEGLKVSHIDGTNGQAEKYPEYFTRKRLEEKL